MHLELVIPMASRPWIYAQAPAGPRSGGSLPAPSRQ